MSIISLQTNEFRGVNSAFRSLEFSDEAVESIWRLVGVILHLGNLNFAESEEESIGEPHAAFASRDDAAAMTDMATMLQVNPAELEATLLTRVLAVSGEIMHKKHNLAGTFVTMVHDYLDTKRIKYIGIHVKNGF